MTSLLTEEALDWDSPVLDQSSPVLKDWNAFLQTFSIVFDDLITLAPWKQHCKGSSKGQGPTALYGAQFWQLAADVEWNEAVQLHHFQHELSEEVKD